MPKHICNRAELPSGGVPVLRPSLSQVAPKAVRDRVKREREAALRRAQARKPTLPKVRGYYDAS